MQRWFTLTLFWVIALLALAGCGGGGGSSVAGAMVRTFASDNLNPDFDHVWVKVLKIELVATSGNVTVLDDTATGGDVVDLRTLRDSSGPRFKMMSTVQVPAGTYTSAKVTLDKSVTLVRTGATTSSTATFAGNDGTTKVMSIDLSTPITGSGAQDLVLDFDLGNWTVDSLSAPTVVSAAGDHFVRHGEKTGIEDSARHESDDYSGLVSDLTGTAPTQTFKITREGRSILVETDASSTLFNNNGSTSPVLANGAKVEVTGVFSTVSNVLLATKVKIEVETESEDQAKVGGIASAIDAAASSVTVTLGKAHGFLPAGQEVVVTAGSAVRYFGASGIEVTHDVFFGLLTVGTSKVEAEGAIVAGNLVANRMKVENSVEGSHHHQAELKGTVSLLNLDTKTFDLTIAKWEGAALTAGQVVHVTATTLPDGIANAVKVEAKGDYNSENATLAASSVRIDN